MKKIIDKLRLPQAKEIKDINDPSTALLQAQIILEKAFLKRLYQDFYLEFKKAVDFSNGHYFVEVGSGPGFIKNVLPNVITSDLKFLPDLDVCFTAHDLPFKNNSIDGFLLLDVLHHINNPRNFFKEALRCLKPDGKIVMIEPANTIWSRFIYQNFHHEAFNPAGGWELIGGCQESDVNGALPWIIFFRDKSRFKAEFPLLKIKRVELHTPLRYLVSGGLSLRQLLPSETYNLIKGMEHILHPFNRYIAMFQTIELEKKENEG